MAREGLEMQGNAAGTHRGCSFPRPLRAVSVSGLVEGIRGFGHGGMLPGIFDVRDFADVGGDFFLFGGGLGRCVFEQEGREVKELDGVGEQGKCDLLKVWKSCVKFLF